LCIPRENGSNCISEISVAILIGLFFSVMEALEK
jgi:hypothetical protein